MNSEHNNISGNLCPYCHSHQEIILSTNPKVVFCNSDFMLEYEDSKININDIYSDKIKRIIDIFNWCDEQLKQLVYTKTKEDTYVLLLNQNGDGILAETNAISHHLLVFPQSLLYQSNYYKYSLCQLITEIMITLLHEYKHSYQSKDLLFMYKSYSDLIEADADIYATRFLMNNFKEIEEKVLSKYDTSLDKKRLKDVHWIALGRLYSFYNSYYKNDFNTESHSNCLKNFAKKIMENEQNVKLFEQLKCQDSLYSKNLSILSSK